MTVQEYTVKLQLRYQRPSLLDLEFDDPDKIFLLKTPLEKLDFLRTLFFIWEFLLLKFT